MMHLRASKSLVRLHAGRFLAGSSGWLNKLLSPRISIEKVQHPIIINTAAVGQGPYDLILQRRDGRVGGECKE